MSPSTEPVVKHVPLDQIDEDPTLQVRVKIDVGKVADYEVIIQETGWMAPMKIFRKSLVDGAAPRFLLSAGAHRIRAYRNCGKKTAPCEILDGGHSEALAEAVASNVKHGLPMTRADKRNAAKLLVEDPVHGQKTDTEIAKMLYVSPSFVNEVRRGIRPQDKKPPVIKKGAPATGKRETESPAPPPAQARQPKKEDPRPTKAAALRQIEQHIDLDVCDEKDVVDLFKSGKGEYKWLAKPGNLVSLKLVGRTGRVLFEDQVVLKEAGAEGFVLKAESVKSMEIQTY